MPGSDFAPCERGLKLPAGTYRARIRLRGVLLGAEVERRLEVRAGASSRVDVDFETGELMLWAVAEGQPAAAEGDVWHDGKVAGRLQQGRAARVGIGTYVVDARAGDATERFGAVHVNPGGRTVLFWQTRR